MEKNRTQSVHESPLKVWKKLGLNSIKSSLQKYVSNKVTCTKDLSQYVKKIEKSFIEKDLVKKS